MEMIHKKGEHIYMHSKLIQTSPSIIRRSTGIIICPTPYSFIKHKEARVHERNLLDRPVNINIHLGKRETK